MWGLIPIAVMWGTGAALASAGVGIILTAQMLAFIGSSLLVSEWAEGRADQGKRPCGLELQHNFCSTEISLPLIYGEARVGGNDVYMHTYGDGNKFLYLVQNLAEGECEGIKEIDGVPQVFIDDQLLSDFEAEHGDLVNYTFYSGTETQTYDTELNTVSGGEWTDNKRGTCYVVWRFEYDPEVFPSIPKRNVILKGRKLWLPDNTKVYSQNAAAVLYDYLRSPHCALALGWPEENMMLTDEIDYYSYLAAYNYCETKGWTFNGAIFHEDMARDVINMLTKHFRGSLSWSDNMFYMGFKDLNYESVAMNLTDDHIARDTNGKAMISISAPGQINTPDGLLVSFINTTGNNYVEDHVPVGESDGVIRDVDLTGYTSREMAGKMGTYILERNRDPYGRIIKGRFRDDCLQLERNDIVTLTCTALGYSAQYMRVIASQRHASGLVTLEMQLEHTDLYNDVFDVETETTYTCTLPEATNFDPVTSAERYIEPEFESDNTLTLELSDLCKVYVIDSNDDLTVYLPSIGTDQLGKWVKFIHYGTGKLTIQAADYDTIDKSSAGGSIWYKEWT